MKLRDTLAFQFAMLLVAMVVGAMFASSISGYFTNRMLEQRVAVLEQELTKAKAILSEVFGREVTDLTTFSTAVELTAYTARPEECDDTPHITADGSLSRVGLIAMSQDMFRKHNLTFGDRVVLYADGKSLGVFEIRDTMNRRWTNRIDILHGNLDAALAFGKKKGRMLWLTRS